MKILKATSIILLTILGLIILWLNLPFSFRYHSEIKSGNQFAENIRLYKQQKGELPKEDDWKTLEKLNPIKPYEAFYPEYRITDTNNFELTFIQGFDPPYLQFSSKNQKWVYK